MLTRIFAIGLIWACTAVAWFALAGTIDYRTRETGERTRSGVEELWGREHRQEAPAVEVSGRSVPLQASDIRVDLDLTHRKKGLQWYPTYRVRFDGTYRVSNPDDEDVEASLSFALPDPQAVYDEFALTVGDQPVDAVVLDGGIVRQTVPVAAGSELAFRVAYTSQGMAEWFYAFGPDAKQVRNFDLTMDTDFDAIDFPESGSSPTEKAKTSEGWRLTWAYENLLSGVQIGMVMPERLNPGPWVKMVSAAAPVSLFLFFFLLFIATTLRRIRLHPMNYFFIAAAFFSYHLLLSYLVDHVSIHLAFWICSAVSIFLVVSYMRLVVGARMAFFEVGMSQFVYLVLFSYTFFFRGFTGLAVTILCIVTLFIVMQATGRLNWEALFRGEHEERDIAPPPPLVGTDA
ncbi:MAG: inner membrane CreD family protein [Planctomycetota bacterium]|jgi:hypothetical protein